MVEEEEEVVVVEVEVEAVVVAALSPSLLGVSHLTPIVIYFSPTDAK